MKKIFVFGSLICFLISSVGAQNDAINRYFEAQLENEIFSSVYVSPKLIEIVSEIDIRALDGGLDDGELQANEAAMIEEILKQLKGLMILRTDVDPMKHYKEILSGFSNHNSDFDLLLSVRDQGNNVKIWTQTSPDNTIQELLLLVGGEDEMIMLSLTGNIDLKKISKLAGSIDVDGIQYLENLDKMEE